jgi:FolB domain-containing protein
MDCIRLQGLRLDLRLGASDAEAARPQPVEVDVELWMPLQAAGRSDDLRDTLDYATLVERIHLALEGRRFHLLEAVAEAVAHVALGMGAREAVVRARKFEPPVKGRLARAEVEVLRSRQPEWD